MNYVTGTDYTHSSSYVTYTNTSSPRVIHCERCGQEIESDKTPEWYPTYEVTIKKYKSGTQVYSGRLCPQCENALVDFLQFDRNKQNYVRHC